MKVFVTGATGLLGSHLLCRLAKEERTIFALKREKSSVELTHALFSLYFHEPAVVRQRVMWVTGDILKPLSLERWVQAADVVYHCAAVVSFRGNNRATLTDINVQGTEQICRLCLKYGKRLCFVSSIAALGDAKHPGDMIDEETPVIEGRPHSVYAESKAMAEQVVWDYVKRGLDVVIVNPAIILGTGIGERSSGQLFERASRGMQVYTMGGNGYVDVRDVCEAMVLLAEKWELSGQRFVVNGGNYSYRELFTIFALEQGKKTPWIRLSPWTTEILWRLFATIAFFLRKEPVFTREMARSSQHISRYSSARLLDCLPNFRFHSLQETIAFFRKRGEMI